MPEKIKELEIDEEYATHIISFYMGFSESYIRRNWQYDIPNNMGAIEDRGPEHGEDITREVYFSENAKIKKMCEDGGAKYFEIDGEYEEEIKKVYDWIEEQKQNVFR